MEKAKVTYRGWPGHFICGDRCIFHLNTLIELGDTRVVVSTVGMMKDYHAPNMCNENKFEEIGFDRYYETMAFHAERRGEFWDADATRQVPFESEWAYSSISDEWRANKGHLAVVDEIVNRLESGQPLDTMEESAVTIPQQPLNKTAKG
jgi:hypothetical protein